MTNRSAGVPAMVTLVVMLLALAGCGQSAASKMPPAQRLAAAQRTLEKAPGVTLSMATTRLPQGVSGVLKASGTGTKRRAFRGSITVVNNGIALPVPVIAVGGTTYVNFGGWQRIDPSKFGAPDPGELFGPNGFSALFGAVRNLRAGEDIRDGKDVLSTLNGTVDGARVAAIIPSANTANTFKVQLQLDDTNTLRRALVTGPFYPHSGDVSYTIDITSYTANPVIKPPAGVR